MKEIPKPLHPDYFDINVLCWMSTTECKPITILYPNTLINELIN